MGSLLDLYATLSIDTSEYEKGIKGAEDKSKGFGEIAKHAFGNLLSDGIEKAASAAIDFGKESIQTGMQFESAMSQVAATMGKPVDEISELTEIAKELGSSTQFSATEAAQGLNFLALAGMDSTQQIATLPHVLDLAAAGNMGLAESADLVTDAMSALGLEFDDNGTNVADFGDKLAKTASTTNTSVSQLGEAILTVGATGKSMTGTFRTMANGEKKLVSGTSHLNAALGILANVGIKGSEGGTHLRNIILSLQSPTDDAAEALENMGVAVYDSEGNMRNMNDILTDMNDSMGDMDQAAKDEVLSKIFNKTDLAAASALLSSAGDEWESLAVKIEDSDGAMSTMAETMNDNLGGKLKEFSSAVEGLEIAIYDKLGEPVSALVEFGTKVVQGFTSALTPAKTDLDNFLEEIQKSHEEVQGLISSAQDTLSGADYDIEELEAYRKIITDLNFKEGLNTFEKYQLKTATEKLSAKIPELAGAYNDETGKIDLSREALDKLFDAQERQIRQTATMEAREKALAGATEALIEKEMAKNALVEATNELDAKRDELRTEFIKSHDMDAYGAYQDMEDYINRGSEAEQARFNEAAETLANAVEDSKEAEELVEKVDEVVGKMASNAEDNSDVIANATEANTENAEQTEEATQAMAESAEEIPEAMGDAMDATTDEVADGMNKTESTVENGMSSVVAEVNQSTGDLEQAWSQSMTNIQTTVTNAMNEVESALSKEYTISIKAVAADKDTSKNAIAMDMPRILNGATIFGEMDGKNLMGGEAGSELVVGMSTMMGMISQAAGTQATAEVFASVGEQIIGILGQYLPQMANQGVYLDSGALVGQIAPQIDSKLGQMASRRAVTAV